MPSILLIFLHFEDNCKCILFRCFSHLQQDNCSELPTLQLLFDNIFLTFFSWFYYIFHYSQSYLRCTTYFKEDNNEGDIIYHTGMFMVQGQWKFLRALRKITRDKGHSFRILLLSSCGDQPSIGCHGKSWF